MAIVRVLCTRVQYANEDDKHKLEHVLGFYVLLKTENWYYIHASLSQLNHCILIQSHIQAFLF
jgi:hypothetical protein